jgi:protocatechuate 3,4-dioxygenase beta subunit
MLRALLLVCALVAGQSPTAVPTGSLVGQVTTGTAPLRHARVVVEGSGNQATVVHTDATGGFQFERLAPGRYRISAAKPGFVPPVPASTPFAPAPLSVDVTAARPTTFNIRLEPGVTIEGLLVSAQRAQLGRTLTQTIVADRLVVDPNGRALEERYKGVVEDAGRFRLPTLPAGKYILHVNAGYFGAPEWYYPGTGNRSEAHVLDLVPGQVHAIGEFALPEGAVSAESLAAADATGSPPGAIEGRIFDEFGDPAPEMLVLLLERRFLAGRFRLYPRSSVLGSAESFISALSDASGRFRFTTLPAGDHYLVAVSDPFARETQPRPEHEGLTGVAPTYFPNTTQSHEARPIVVRAGETVRDVNVTLSPTQTGHFRVNHVDRSQRTVVLLNSGTVVAAMPLLPGLTTIGLISGLTTTPPDVLYQNQGGEPQPAARAPLRTSDGSNVIRNIPVGDYLLWSGMETIPVFIGAGVNTIDLPPRTYPPTGPVNGQVVFDDPSIAPAREQVEIAFELTDVGRLLEMGGIGTRAVAVFQNEWSFRLPHDLSQPWPRVIRVNAPPGWALARVTAAGTDITDTPTYFGGPQTANVQVVLTKRTGTVTGQVFDGSQPTARHGVIIFPEERERRGFLSRFAKVAHVNAQGQFEIAGLLPGPYLALPLPNNTDEGADPEWLDLMRPTAIPVTVTEGETARITVAIR